MSTDRPADRPRRRRRRQVITRWFVIVVVVALLAGSSYAIYNYQRFAAGITHIDAISSANAPSRDLDGQDQNILLVGDDHRPANATAAQLAQLGTEQDGGGTSTDTMIVLHLPANGDSPTLISFPRDSWVDIPGFGKNKLNAAFAFGSENDAGDVGGAQLLTSVIQNMTGLTIDHFVRVSMMGFYNIAQALGPIQVCLNAAVNDPYSTINLPAGISTLNAQQALAFVRQRHGLPQGDLDREVRQRYFLSMEARQLLSAGTLLDPVKLPQVLDAVSASLQTDPGLNLLDLATRFGGLNPSNITSTTIPVSGTPTITVNGADVSVVQVDQAAMPAFISGIIGTATAYTTATASPVSDVTVTVLNGGSTNGAAATNTATLKSLGFATGVPSSTSARPNTTIEYPPGKEGDAKALAAFIPGADPVSTGTGTDITLVLGTDGKQVTVPTAAPAAPAAPPAPAASPSAGEQHFAGNACID
ncbi:LytR family transcriptional regulator [Cryobacterium sp. MDB2-10]|uniref:LytR family transcriptional regulator n=1 Tax=Cryobacterium glucosi TaxID=1259175 RepID=A0ABY2IMJ4_9MICO|nr:LytR family transcriptional regulator [Cryobacterium sp. MDB2-A-1]TFC07567.1 LytR family transcriptional regulator [Cryobacterium sp. MDB2-33-2]TFC08938.1 LytR family transcriptional regulator [Cryobacterium sp. MDB2-A-2]TFC19037.1 LytR family transcriptional regulator [Cryobacterium glucosi]TFC19456.1 LytR family transcriptional regulator [Cryobacterium sp. MDB2-10]